jgi:hypothetical protein
MARSKSRRSTALSRRSVSVKPVVIKQTKVIKQKRKGGRRSGGGGSFMSREHTSMMVAGAALGFLDKSAFVASLPKLPYLNEHGTIALAAYMLSKQSGTIGQIAGNVCSGALFLAAYELVKTGKIEGDEQNGYGF